MYSFKNIAIRASNGLRTSEFFVLGFRLQIVFTGLDAQKWVLMLLIMLQNVYGGFNAKNVYEGLIAQKVL